jgi:hypothetical protein
METKEIVSQTWTAEQILALAPDASSAKNGKGLATKQKWNNIGRGERILWGECQGSGANPYRTQIDLGEPAFKCSCPSRKFPCKHGLGLFLLFANEIGLFVEVDAPDWVQAWLDSRQQRQEKKQQKAETPVDPAAQAKRRAARETKVTAGVEELQRWLGDLIRQGLAIAQGRDYNFWEQPAARMVDAQAPGLARYLREMASIAHSGPGWMERLLQKASQLHLLLSAYHQIDRLPKPLQADIRTQIGWSVSEEELLAQAATQEVKVISDDWAVLGQRDEVDDKLRIRRIWLRGERSHQKALMLLFAHGTQPFTTVVLPGTVVTATLVFYESAHPLRAIIRERAAETRAIAQDDGFESILDNIVIYTTAIAQMPWLERYPMGLQAVIPQQQEDEWILRESGGQYLPVAPSFDRMWEVCALAGGKAIGVFGEWNGKEFYPCSLWVENRLIVV